MPTSVDRPGDGGNAILLTWTDPALLPEGTVLEVRRSEPPADEFAALQTVKPGTPRYVDAYRRAVAIRAERASGEGL